jgi:hypothetical protein
MDEAAVVGDVVLDGVEDANGLSFGHYLLDARSRAAKSSASTPRRPSRPDRNCQEALSQHGVLGRDIQSVPEKSASDAAVPGEQSFSVHRRELIGAK